MAFSARLKESLELRETQVPAELFGGESLNAVLTRDLLAVEGAADTDMLTSILLLDGNKLRHGAAPSLSPAFCAAIDGVEIGPAVGSCGTAAYFGRPVHVVDTATDPLWADYLDLALTHGLRACWSTPIFDDRRKVLGTFAIYHLQPRAPTAEEVEAIRSITDHVARAIMFANASAVPALKLVTDDYGQVVGRPGETGSKLLANIASNFDAIRQAIDAVMDVLPAHDPRIGHLRRARDATLRGSAWARGTASSD